MGLMHRPYVGTWRLGQRKVVQHTPDALVYINGDISLPGCQKCHSAINIQQFVTSVSVDAGCDAAGASGNFTLSVPVHHIDSFARDAQFLLHPGLEVHIYMRGYFPVKGLYSNLGTAMNNPEITFEASGESNIDYSNTTYSGHMESTLGETPILIPGVDLKKNVQLEAYAAQLDQLWALEGPQTIQDFPRERVLYIAMAASEETGVPLEWLLGNLMRESKILPAGRNQEKKDSETEPDTNTAFGSTQVLSKWFDNFAEDPRITWEHSDLIDPRLATWTMAYTYQNAMKGKDSDTLTDLWAGELWRGKNVGLDGSNAPAEQRAKTIGEFKDHLAYWKGEAAGVTTDDYAPGSEPVSAPVVTPTPGSTVNPSDVSWGDSLVNEAGLSGVELENMLAYPYYHTFHGVVTSVAHSWSAGSQNITIQCASMLHFWQYHQMSTNASLFGARPQNSKARVSMVGHNFTGMHPYEIMYTLHNDTAGAAGGVAYALSKKTNQTARSPITGESLFSLNLRYWQHRFNQRETKLRLHGASGSLFNSAQATFLSRLKGSELTRLLKSRFQDKGTSRSGDIFSAALTLGLLRPSSEDRRKQMIEALKFARSNPNNPDSPTPSFELNLAEMIAFVNNISQWGQVQLFESTYESKLDIAQKVCEVTGFEFYQDVDGDFVFKPPMYNLDTSGSRVYRLEDIDIISINFDEKEPQVTYMTVKGTFTKNIVGHGVEGEWGVQGQYIDYRLVAQFGWRPGNYETAYFNDTKSMFFSAINRMDIMNAPANSASVTIPMRPELRPGYPVYIPYLDCFYYCNSFAHAYQVGGQCTTTLQLIGKRAKFYAPGDPAQVETLGTNPVLSGIDAIKLDYPAFPPTPLEVQGKDGRPQLSGFPNVVMALDPEQFNPLFFLVGSDIDSLDSYQSLFGLLKMGVDLNILTVTDKGNPGPLFTMSADDGNTISFWYPTDPSQPNELGGIPIKVVAAMYQDRQAKFTINQVQLRKDFEKANRALGVAQNKQSDLNKNDVQSTAKDKTKAQAAVTAAEAKVAKVRAQFDSAITAFDESLGDSSDTASVGYFVELIRRTGNRFLKDAQFGTAYKDPNATTTLLDLLGDKKASLSNGSLPGMYRYYSASHPQKEYQGQPVKKIKKTDTGTSSDTLTPNDMAGKTLPVPTFLPSNEIEIQPNGVLPQAQLGARVPIWGIKVLTNRIAGGEFVPTNEIREMMFSPVEVTLSRGKSKTIKRSWSLEFGGGFLSKVESQIVTLAAKATLEQTPQSLFSVWLTLFNSTGLVLAALAANAHGTAPIADLSTFVVIPDAFYAFGAVWPSTTPLSTYKLADNPSASKKLFRGSSTRNSIDVWKNVAQWFAGNVQEQVRAIKDQWLESTVAQETSHQTTMERLDLFVKTLAGPYGDTVPKKFSESWTVRTPITVLAYPPVFPVSDARGYTVIGSYRYGRDVDTDPGGVLDQLTRQDPLSLLSQDLVEDIVDVITLGKGDDSVKEVERKVLQSLRDNLTDEQILDLGLARTTGDPTELQINLINFLTDKAKDGVHKIPLVNAGYSLAELTSGLKTTTCTCKAAEADILLDIAGHADFIQVDTPGSPTSSPLPLALGEQGLDDVTRLLMSSSMGPALDWEMSQEALRGSLPDMKPSSVVRTIKDLKKTYEDFAAQQKAAADNLKSTSKNVIGQANEGVVDAFTGEEN